MFDCRVSEGVVVGLALVVLICGACARHETKTEAPVEVVTSNPYLGESPPGSSPVLFAPGIVSTDTREWSMASTPDGLELFFGVVTEGRSWILHTMEVDGQWTELAVASFSGDYDDYDLTMSPDGNRVYFTSNRPPDGVGPVLENSDIWYVDRTEDGWGDPVRFPEPVNSEARDLYPSQSRDGYVYFFSLRSGGFGDFDLYRVAPLDDGFGVPENLGPSINTAENETDACISPDGDYLVFTSTREGGYGSGDLYVSFRTEDGGWTRAVNLGETVNTEHLEFCPSVSRDGRYLFLTSNRPKAQEIPSTPGIRDELGVAPSLERPDIDIYWIDAGFIESFRPGVG
jgi:Tol biopolymer transport system component